MNSSPLEDTAPPITGNTELLQQVLTRNQELVQLLSDTDEEICSNNTNRPPTPSTGPRQGQPHHTMPVYFDKYCWTHGRGSHKGGN